APALASRSCNGPFRSRFLAGYRNAIFERKANAAMSGPRDLLLERASPNRIRSPPDRLGQTRRLSHHLPWRAEAVGRVSMGPSVGSRPRRRRSRFGRAGGLRQAASLFSRADAHASAVVRAGWG